MESCPVLQRWPLSSDPSWRTEHRRTKGTIKSSAASIDESVVPDGARKNHLIDHFSVTVRLLVWQQRSLNRVLNHILYIFVILLNICLRGWKQYDIVKIENQLPDESFLDANTAFKPLSTSMGDGGRGCLTRVLGSNPGFHGQSCWNPWIPAH